MTTNTTRNTYTEDSIVELTRKIVKTYGKFNNTWINRPAPKGVTTREYTQEYTRIYGELIREGYFTNRYPKSPKALIQQVKWITTTQSITESKLAESEGYQNTLLRNRIASINSGFLTEGDVDTLFDLS